MQTKQLTALSMALLMAATISIPTQAKTAKLTAPAIKSVSITDNNLSVSLKNQTLPADATRTLSIKGTYNGESITENMTEIAMISFHVKGNDLYAVSATAQQDKNGKTTTKKSKTAYLLTQPGTTVSAESDGIHVSWNLIGTKTKYQVLASFKKASGFKKLKTTTGSSYTFKKVGGKSVAGKTVYVKVNAQAKAGGKTVKSSGNTVLSVTGLGSAGTSSTQKPKIDCSGFTGSNESVLYQSLRAAGFTREGACGFMGNVYCESGMIADQGYDSDGYDSYGLCLWTSGRKKAMINHCKKYGLDYKSVQGQCSYLVNEDLNSYSKVKKFCSKTTDIYEAAGYVAQHFEKCAHAKTKAEATNWTNKYGVHLNLVTNGLNFYDKYPPEQYCTSAKYKDKITYETANYDYRRGEYVIAFYKRYVMSEVYGKQFASTTHHLRASALKWGLESASALESHDD